MRWLLTVGKDVDLDELRSALAQLGSTVDPASGVPLDDDEQVVGAEGPNDLPSRLAQAGLSRVKAYPDSDLELYEPSDPPEETDEAEAGPA
jgi:hypothetical protein